MIDIIIVTFVIVSYIYVKIKKTFFYKLKNLNTLERSIL